MCSARKNETPFDRHNLLNMPNSSILANIKAKNVNLFIFASLRQFNAMTPDYAHSIQTPKSMLGLRSLSRIIEFSKLHNFRRLLNLVPFEFVPTINGGILCCQICAHWQLLTKIKPCMNSLSRATVMQF